MAGNFWQSSHYQEWLLDRQVVELGRQRDVQHLETNDNLQKVHIFFANFIQCLGGEHLKLRQQVISTAIVYYRRFYSRNSVGDIDPLLLCPTCHPPCFKSRGVWYGTHFTAGGKMSTNGSTQVQWRLQAGLSLQEQPHYGMRVSPHRTTGLLSDCVPSLPPAHPIRGRSGTTRSPAPNSMEDSE